MNEVALFCTHTKRTHRIYIVYIKYIHISTHTHTHTHRIKADADVLEAHRFRKKERSQLQARHNADIVCEYNLSYDVTRSDDGRTRKNKNRRARSPRFFSRTLLDDSQMWRRSG